MSNHKIAVVTDSSAYIPESALVGLNVSTIPLWLIWGNERFRDGIDIDPPSFYRRLQQSKILPTSSQPSPGEFINFYKRVATKADAIVSVLVSSKISGTIANAQAAQAQLSGLTIRIVDSLSSSMGLGLVVLAAARAAASGSIDDVIAAAERMREKIHFLFVVETLEYLHRGGRIGESEAFIGDGVEDQANIAVQRWRDRIIVPRTDKRKAIAQMLKIVEQRLDRKRMAEAAVVDIDTVDEGDTVAEMVAERFGTPMIHRSTVSPVVGTHVGPGAIGLAFYSK